MLRDKRVYLAQGTGIPHGSQSYRCFYSRELEYIGFCDDFGPMNASCVIKFVTILQTELARYPNDDLVYCVDTGRRNLTNAAFLLGAYMIIVFKEQPRNIWACFASLSEHTFEPFRDATFSDSEFDLTLLDCWEALARGRSLGWIDKPTSPGVWGRIILEEYDHYEDPLNGDLHIVVPDRFVAFKGPKDFPGGREFRDARGTRDFSPYYYVEIFKELGVKAVVRLNECLYDERAFEDNGIRLFDLEFDDCTTPPDSIVAAFFRAVDSVEGLVAVHCKAGLGRTGTLIALDLMRRFKFAAREAVGWLRIMRPGSVIGDQQRYLCDVERAVREADAAAAAASDGGAPAASGMGGALERRTLSAGSGAGIERRTSSANSEALARQVAEAMDRRAAERIHGRR